MTKMISFSRQEYRTNLLCVSV
uniref:Uncharacterized protein n=1 Tax=Arundo donax TaxID=35708 RepID=A0A0A8YDH5_ARUDO